MKNLAHEILLAKAQLLLDQRYHAIVCHIDSAVAIDYVVEDEQKELRLLLSGQLFEDCLRESPNVEVLSKKEFTELVRSKYSTEVQEISQLEFRQALATRPSLHYQASSEICSFKSSALYAADLTTIHASLRDLASGQERFFKFIDSVKISQNEIKNRVASFLALKAGHSYQFKAAEREF